MLRTDLNNSYDGGSEKWMKASDAIAAASCDGELQQKIKAQGIKPDIVALGAFDSYIDGDLARLAPLVNGVAEKP
jgi:tripartite-type tricarboxylate transporter receptor subunit TctC